MEKEQTKRMHGIMKKMEEVIKEEEKEEQPAKKEPSTSKLLLLLAFEIAKAISSSIICYNHDI